MSRENVELLAKISVVALLVSGAMVGAGEAFNVRLLSWLGVGVVGGVFVWWVCLMIKEL